jgi:hypothetical protein
MQKLESDRKADSMSTVKLRPQTDILRGEKGNSKRQLQTLDAVVVNN